MNCLEYRTENPEDKNFCKNHMNDMQETNDNRLYYNLFRYYNPEEAYVNDPIGFTGSLGPYVPSQDLMRSFDLLGLVVDYYLLDTFSHTGVFINKIIPNYEGNKLVLQSFNTCMDPYICFIIKTTLKSVLYRIQLVSGSDRYPWKPEAVAKKGDICCN